MRLLYIGPKYSMAASAVIDSKGSVPKCVKAATAWAGIVLLELNTGFRR